tara:strand:+ start:240 stop:533 length:294 start_codon:yes stop_codon:yes gene_type:complete
MNDKTKKGQSAADTLNYMKEGIPLTKMQEEKLKKFLVEEAEDIGMTSRHPDKKKTKKRRKRETPPDSGKGTKKRLGGIEKRFKGGLMVKPKTAKRGY